jgi:DNA repair ATPase RecN
MFVLRIGFEGCTLEAIHKLLRHIMAKFDEFYTAQKQFNEDMSKSVDGLVIDSKTLNDKIAALIASLGELTPEQQVKADELLAQGATLSGRLKDLDEKEPPPTPV